MSASSISILVRTFRTLAVKGAQSYGREPVRRKSGCNDGYMCSITFVPNSEHLISVAPSISRAKS
jgi:hypothetical protein